MAKIKLLIVDDSSAVRRILSSFVKNDPDIEIVDQAENGAIALQKIAQHNPDIVTLDIEMPVMDGISAITEIRKTNKKLPVIMLSTLSQRGSLATLDALSKGASDYLPKPTAMQTGDSSQSYENIRVDLIKKIKALAPVQQLQSFSSIVSLQKTASGSDSSIMSKSTSQASSFVQSRPLGSLANIQKFDPSVKGMQNLNPQKALSRVDVVVIGVSTGGPNALQALFAAMPKNFPIPILIVQHMPAQLTALLAERLNSVSQLSVKEAKAGDLLQTGYVYIAPGDYHMTVARSGVNTAIALNQEQPENSCRPAVDVTMRSVSQMYKKNMLAVILTGMGQDGMLGCKMVQENGGAVLAQDQSTSVVWGMPGAVVGAGLADMVLPLQMVSTEIVKRAVYGRR